MHVPRTWPPGSVARATPAWPATCCRCPPAGLPPASAFRRAAARAQAKGNAAFSAGKFQEAVEHFTAAIAADPANHVLYSNRSAAHASLSAFQPALEDAQKTVELNPGWAKGYSRLGAAYYGLRQWDDAVEAYTKGERRPRMLSQALACSRHGMLAAAPPAITAASHPSSLLPLPWTAGLQLDPANAQLKQGLEDARGAAASSAARSPAGGLGGLFSQPEVLSRLATNPQTRAFLQQPDFMQMLSDINRNPGGCWDR